MFGMSGRTGSGAPLWRTVVASQCAVCVAALAVLGAVFGVSAVASASANQLGEVTDFSTGSVGPVGAAGTVQLGPEGDIWYEGLHDPYGGGGLGQINPTTGALANYGSTGNAFNQFALANGNFWFTGEYQNELDTFHLATLEARHGPNLSESSGTIEEFTTGYDGNVWGLSGGRISEVEPTTNSFYESNGKITSFDLPGSETETGPLYGRISDSSMARGPEGDVWFTIHRPGALGPEYGFGRVSPSGQITEFWPGNLYYSYGQSDEPPDNFPTSLVDGPDNTLWFTQTGTNQVGVFTPTSGAITGEYSAGITADSEPRQIVEGSEGDMWFTQPGSDQLGRINPTTNRIAEFSTGAGSEDAPGAIVVGPEGNLWFTQGPRYGEGDVGNQQIGRMGTEGGQSPVITTEPVSDVVTAPAAATFTVDCAGAPAPTVRWEVSTNTGSTWAVDATDTGSTTDDLSVSPTSLAMNGDEYRAACENAEGGPVLSNAASLGVLANSASATSSSPSGSVTALDGPALTATASDGEGTVTAGQYDSDPIGIEPVRASGNYIDVSLSSGSTFTSLEFTDCELNGASQLEWWNPAAKSGAGGYESVSDETAPSGSPPCITVTVNNSTSPDLAQMTGTVFAGVVAAGPKPTLKKLSAKKGRTAGGTPVTITGTGFAGVSEVKFGSHPATKITFHSDTSITVTSPPASAGKVDVTVTTPNGTSTASSKYAFTYKAAKKRK
jgi:streptogramin lyase